MKYKTIISAIAIVFFTQSLVAQDGKALFNKQCKACHTIGNGKKIGPDLKGISDKRSFEWISKFILSSKDLIASGDDDAIAVFEEYGQKPMPSHKMSAAEINAMMNFINRGGDDGSAVAQKEEVIESFTANAETGRVLFTGGQSFAKGGASCISCHSIKDYGVFAGGNFAKDLSVSHAEGIVESMVSSIPAMISSYKNHELTVAEKQHLEAFLKDVKENQLYSHPVQSGSFLFLGGTAIFILLFLLANIFWKQSKKGSVKDEIFQRQMKSV